jgi:3-methyl-2-oxobutanoate hydroxymethyltransferase
MAQIGGYKAQGRSAAAALALIDQAKKLEAAGCWAVLIEGVPAAVGKAVHDACKVPVYGIGAGSHVDGQLIIYADMVGYYDDFCPKFVKQYAQVGKVLQGAFEQYVKEVHEGVFPDDSIHTYKMPAEEQEKLAEALK